MSQATPSLGAPSCARNPEPPAYPKGTHVHASCDLYEVSGPLVSDHADLDGIVSLWDEAEGEIVQLHGYLWAIDVAGEVRP
jgi:hypothetical protein